MSQHDFEIANQGFPSFRSDLNNGLQALASNSAGATEPSTTYAYQFWYDSTANLLKMRNTDDDAWITLAYFDQTNDEWEVRSAVIQAVDSAGVTIKTDDGNSRISVADDGTVSFNDGNITNVGTIDVDSIRGDADTNTSIDFDGSDVMTFNTGGSEAARIDSSGNLLVGKTSSSESSVGVELKPSSAIVTRNNDAPLKLRRNTSDGDILQFAKDDTVVGAIGTYSGYISVGSGDVYVLYNSTANALLPASTATAGTSDGAIDLASSSRRFKDLYLSGGVYLGGTTSANYIEDYEEGTWTPVLEGSTTAGTYTYDTARTLGTYTKIGNTVFLSGSLRVSGVTSAGTGDALISGLPFTPSKANQGSYPRRPHPVLFQSATTLGSSSIFSSIENDVDYIGLRTQSTSTIAAVSVTDADDVDSIWAFSVVYKVS